MNERSDNAIARNNFNVDTYLNAKLGESLKEEGQGQRRSVTQLLYTLLALGVFTEPTEGEIIPLSKNNHFDLSRPKPQQLRGASRRFQERVAEHKEAIKTQAGSTLENIGINLSIGSTSIKVGTPASPVETPTPVSIPQTEAPTFDGWAKDAMNKMSAGKIED